MHLAIFALACLLLCQDSKGIQESPFNLINLGAMPSQRVFTVQNFANNDQDDSMMTASHLRPSQTGTTDTDRYNVCDISPNFANNVNNALIKQNCKTACRIFFSAGCLHCSRLLLIFFPLPELDQAVDAFYG